MDIYNSSHQNYGAPKITSQLQRSGEIISERTVGKYMRDLNIKAQWVKPFIHTTIAPDFSTKLQNILDEQFNPARPNAAWCSDITYIPTARGFVYLTSVMDLFSRKIIAWTLSETLEAEHVANTVRKAMRQRKVTTPLVMHSDRGSQYVSAAYLEAAAGLTLSYSKKGILTTTRASNHFIRSSNASGSTVLKFVIMITQGNSFLSISTLFIIPFVFTVIAISARLMTLKICTIFPLIPPSIL